MAEHECKPVDLNLRTEKDVVEIGETFEVEVVAISEGAVLSGARVVLRYNPDALQYAGYDKTLDVDYPLYEVRMSPWGGLPLEGLCADIQAWDEPWIDLEPGTEAVLFRLRFMAIEEGSTGINIIAGFGARTTTKVIDRHSFQPDLTGRFESITMRMESSKPRRQCKALQLAVRLLVRCRDDDYKAAALVEHINELLEEGE